MLENDISLNANDAFIVRPLIVSCISVLTLLAVLNAKTAPGSLGSVKGVMVFVFITGLFIVTSYSWKYFIWLYVGGAILQGFSFLVPPSAIEQKFFFSYFFLNFGPLKVYLADLFLLVAFIILVLQMLLPYMNSRDSLFNNWLTRCIALFVVVGCLICLMSVQNYGKSALGEARSVWYVILFFVSARYFNSYSKIINFFRFFIFVTIIRSGINFLTVFIAPEYLSHDRPFGSNGDAAYCALSFLLVIVLGEQVIRKRYLRKIVAIWLGIFPLLITSRSTLLCLALALVIYALMAKQVSIRTILISSATTFTLGAVAFFSVLSVPQLNSLITSRFLDLFNNYQNDPTSNWRLLGWLFALESIKSNPLLGIGFGSYAERFIDGRWITVSLHSAYLDYLYTIGLAGLLPFVASLLVSLRLLVKNISKCNVANVKLYAICLFVIIVFYMMFIGLNAEMSYALTGTVLWIFLGMVPFITNTKRILLTEARCYEKP